MDAMETLGHVSNHRIVDNMWTEGLVSIIIPVYNGEKNIEKCINSILNQTYKIFEVIIVNDGSVDLTEMICCSLIMIDTRIIVVNQRNEGVSEARNIGLRLAVGEYIRFVDSDDMLTKESVEIALEFQKQYNSDCVAFGWYRKDREKSTAISEAFELVKDSSLLRKNILKGFRRYGGGYPWNKMWRRSSDLAIQEFDKKLYYFEDLEWVIRMFEGIKTLVVCPQCLYIYNINEDGVTLQKYNRERNELGYHLSMEKTLHDLRSDPELYNWFYELYMPEIVNGYINAMRKGWNSTKKYLLERIIQNKRVILQSQGIEFKTKIRLIIILAINMMFYSWKHYE